MFNDNNITLFTLNGRHVYFMCILRAGTFRISSYLLL